MDLRLRSLSLAALFCLVLFGIQISKSAALVAAQHFNPSYPKAISVATNSYLLHYLQLFTLINFGLPLFALEFSRFFVLFVA